MAKKSETKIAKLQRMLARPKGATLETLCKATGWQKHSVRAAITGLRKSGHDVAREDGDTCSVYKIIATEETAG